MVLVGITNDDNKEVVEKMADKLINLRIFEDENEKLNLSLMDVKGKMVKKEEKEKHRYRGEKESRQEKR